MQFSKYVNKKNKVKSKQGLDNYQIFPSKHKSHKHEESSPTQKLPNLKHANNMLNGIIQTKLKISHDEKVLAHELVHVVQQNNDKPVQRKIIQKKPKKYTKTEDPGGQ